MSPTNPSDRFLQIYYSLPFDAQNALLEKHLAPVLDNLCDDITAQVLSSAATYQKQLEKLPVLDIKGKRKQIDYLLDELNRDHKNAFIKERSNLEEMLDNIVQSLVEWLNDIWLMTFEYHVNFGQAHTCLLFTAEVLKQLSDHPAVGNCRCPLMRIPVDFTIWNKRREPVKSFSLTGVQALEDALLWIWRDVFVSLYAYGSKHDQAKIPHMLDDVEILSDWRKVVGVLLGGKRPDSDDQDWVDDDESVEFGDYSEVEEDNEYLLYPCHWPDGMQEHRLKLRAAVRDQLFATFENSPELNLYICIVNMSPDPPATRVRLHKILDELAFNDPDSLVAALDVYTSESNGSAVVKLLKSSSYLLRPRDNPSLRMATLFLSRTGSTYAYALEVLEKEIMNSIMHIRACIHSTFRHIDKPKNQKELEEILELRVGSTTRRERIERWAESVLSPTVDPMNPMAFAAMMFGFPPGPGMENDEADLMGLVDLDESDPDVANLRDEFKPNLKTRLVHWTADGASMKGGIAILANVYIKASETMPYLKASDVVDEMLSRLSERPNKHHISEALEALTAFCKLQRKQLGAKIKAKKRRQPRASASTPGMPPSAANTSIASASSNMLSPSSSLETSATTPPSPPSQPASTGQSQTPYGSSPFGPPPPLTGPEMYIAALPFPLFSQPLPTYGPPPPPPAPPPAVPPPPQPSSPHRGLRPRPADIEDVD